jgi:hypothetical protein
MSQLPDVAFHIFHPLTDTAPQAGAEQSMLADALLAAALSDRVVTVTEAARPCERILPRLRCRIAIDRRQ